MERGWIETMVLLGLDVVLAVTLALAAAEWVVRRLAGRRAHEAPVRRRGTVVAEPRSVDPPAGPAWPPGPWRTSH